MVYVPEEIAQKAKQMTERSLPELNIPSTKEAPDVEYFSDTEVFVPDSARAFIEQYRSSTTAEKITGLAVEAGEGLTFGFLGELAAGVKAATTKESYDEAKEKYESARKTFLKKNPLLEKYVLPIEFIASIPTGIGLAKTLVKSGVKSKAKIGGIEGGLYGFGTGESAEERAINTAVVGLTGFGLGKVVSFASKSQAAGGLKSQADETVTAESDIDDMALQLARDAEVFTEVDVPKYTRKPLKEAQTIGEFWDSTTSALAEFYNDKLTGVSDAIAREMPEVGFRFQRVDETALREVNLMLDGIAEDLVPVIRVVNQDENAKGLLLDYGAGFLGDTFEDSLKVLRSEMGTSMSEQQLNTLTKYLKLSREKNRLLNEKVFGAEFNYSTYLHTRNNANARRMKQQGMSDADIEKKVFEDAGMEKRTRKSWLAGGDDAPNVSDYDNPIVSDMQRIFQMEKFNQIGRIFGTQKEMDNILAPKRMMAEEGQIVALSPKEVMDALFNTLVRKGISNDGADYAVKKMTDSILGANKAPHPLIQAASSSAYATTLAGTMSAILNVADIPLLGAKYGGGAVVEGLKVLTPFKKIPNIDLKKAGLNNQTMGEFHDRVNDEISGGAEGFSKKLARLTSKGTELAMKGSGFVALDQIGKKGVLRGILSSAVKDAKNGNLADNWGFYFNDVELKAIQGQLLKHGIDHRKYEGEAGKLVEELMFAGLGQQQLISSAGRPAAWARNPNLRPLWALRGFVLKQQALALRETVGNIKAGNPDKAVDFLRRYAFYGAGGYAVINEGRQATFGDGEVSASGIIRGYGDAWVSLLTANTLGLNDYQYGKIQQEGFLLTMLKGSEPLVTSRLRDIGGDIVEAVDGEKSFQEVFVDATPLVKQAAQGAKNIGGMFDLPSLEQTGESILERDR